MDWDSFVSSQNAGLSPVSIFNNLGWSPVQSAGIVGNLQHESASPNLNPLAVGDGGRAFGIAQWHPDRIKGLLDFAKQYNLNPKARDTQILYVDHELRNSEASAGNKLSQATTPQEATAAMVGFERPKGYTPSHPENAAGFGSRLANAQALAQPMTVGSAPTWDDFVAQQSKSEAPPIDMSRDPLPGEVPGVTATQAPQEAPYQPTPWNQIAEDAASSAISGGIKGGVALAGAPADIGALLPNVPTANPLIEGAKAAYQILPGSQAIGDWVKSKIGDYNYKPKTGAGEIIQPVFEYGVGGGGLGAEGGLAKQGVQAVLPGLGAEAGKLVGGTPGEIAGAVLASHGAGAKPKLPEAPAVTAADRAASALDMVNSPGTEAVKRVSQEAYKKAEAAGVNIAPTQFNAFATSLNGAKDLRGASQYPSLMGVIKQIQDEVSPMAKMTGFKQPALSLERFDELRKQVTPIAMKSPDPNERRLAGNLINRMDDFFDSTVRPSNPAAGEAIDAARSNWRIYRKSEMIDQAMEAAKDKAGQYSVSGNENAIRTKFRQLNQRIIADKRTRALFTPDERKQIASISRGYKLRDALKTLGKLNLNNYFALAKVGSGAGLAGGATLLNGGDPSQAAYNAALGAGAALGVGALGSVSRAAAGGLAKRQVNQLSKLVRGGGKMKSAQATGLPYSAGLAAGLLNLQGQ